MSRSFLRSIARCLRTSASGALLAVGALSWLSGTPTRAQTAAVDPIFGSSSLGLAGNVYGLALQPDGKLLVAGGHKGLVRLNSDGSTDTGFNAFLGFAPLPFSVQRDGKILLYGYTTDDGTMTGAISRLNGDGSLDRSFDTSTSFDDNFLPSLIAPQDDGRVLVASMSDYFSDDPTAISLVRLNQDGSLDTGFQAAIKLKNTGYDLEFVSELGNGQIMIAGEFSQVNGVARKGVARLNDNGTLDTTYNVKIVGPVSRAGIQPDGKLIVTGNFKTIDGTAVGNVARLNVDGTLDTSFAYDGNFSPFQLVIGPGGEILLGGSIDGIPGYSIRRLNADGSIAADFTATLNSSFQSLIVQPDGTIVIGGSLVNHVNGLTCNSVAKLKQDGSTDTSFVADFASGPNNTVSATLLQPDGKVLISGKFTALSGVDHQGIARLKSDGTADPTFNANVTYYGLNATINKLALQPDGKIILGGFFSVVNGVNVYASLCRLNEDGSFDDTFTSADNGNPPGALARQPDGKVLVGTFSNHDSENDPDGASRRTALIRLNPDGSLDTDFQVDVFLNDDNSIVNDLAVQPDGKILVGGAFDWATGTPPPGLLRLNGDGSLDSTFHADFGPNAEGITSVALQPDGKILAAGYHNSADGFSIFNYLFRFSADGSPDATFQTSLDGGIVAKILLQPDGTLIIGGSFTMVNGAARKGLAHLRGDGSLDPFITQEAGVDSYVSDMALQPDGKVLLGGDFTAVDGVLRDYMARIGRGGAPDFFGAGVPVGNGFYYLQFATGNPFGYYNVSGDGYSFPYFYHADLGMEYFFDAQDSDGGAYFYDFTSKTFFYTSPSFPFPYLYDFSLNSTVYYYPDSSNPGRYNTNGVRYFYVVRTGEIITK